MDEFDFIYNKINEDGDILKYLNYESNEVKIFKGFNNSILNNHKSKRKNFIIEFTVTDFYNDNIVLMDKILLKARNLIDLKNKYSNNDLKNIIGLRHYPRKLGYINILGIKGE